MAKWFLRRARRSLFFMIFLCTCFTQMVWAQADAEPATQHGATPALGALTADMQLVGQGVFRYVFWRVYEAAFYAPQGQWQAHTGYEKPFMLRLTYARALSGQAIAERSVAEMRKQGFKNEALLDQWLKAMENIFPDVNEGTTLSGVHLPGKGAYFYADDSFIGKVADVQFSQHFFDIWLSEETTAPAFRRDLLGL